MIESMFSISSHQQKGEPKFVFKGKYLSEALIFTSTNPQCDDRLFIELRVQYMKIASSEHVSVMLLVGEQGGL